jgi:hypothetical protein
MVFDEDIDRSMLDELFGYVQPPTASALAALDKSSSPIVK